MVSIETQTIEVRDEVVDRRQRDKDKQVSPINPWDHMHRAARETEEQPHKLLPLHKAPTGRNNQSKRVNKPFLIKKYKESRRKMVEEQDGETTFSPTNSSKEYLSTKQIPQNNF